MLSYLFNQSGTSGRRHFFAKSFPTSLFANLWENLLDSHFLTLFDGICDSTVTQLQSEIQKLKNRRPKLAESSFKFGLNSKSRPRN